MRVSRGALVNAFGDFERKMDSTGLVKQPSRNGNDVGEANTLSASRTSTAALLLIAKGIAGPINVEIVDYH